jgi:hypothetical protein
MATKTVTYQVGRNAINGHFTTVKFAQTHPRITTIETMKRPR